MSEEIDLIEFIREIDDFDYVFINSFRYNQNFFEREIFPIFKGKSFPIILIDYNEYQNVALEFGESFLAGRKYIIESIIPHIKRLFHSKLLLCVGKKKIIGFIGSNNLTYQGYKKNAELVVPITIDLFRKKNICLIKDIIDYIENLKSFLFEQYKTIIDKLILRLKQIEGKFIHNGGMKRRSSWILHNINKPLLPKIKEIIGDYIQEITVISPYFSNNKHFYQEILNSCQQIKVIIQQKTNNLPVDILKEFKHISYFQIIINEDKDRFLHSKLLLFKTANETYLFCGSANFTRPALISNENIELGILSKLDISLEYILNEFGEIKEIKLNDIKSQFLEIDDKPMENIDFSITDAVYIDNKIILKISEDLSSLKDKIYLCFGKEKKGYKLKVYGNKLEFTVPKADVNILKKSLAIKIIVEDKGVIKSSDYRILFSQQFFPERFDFLNSFNLNDANYIFLLLNKLAKLPHFNDYLPVLNYLADQNLFTLSEKEIAILLLNKKIMRFQPYNHQLTLKEFIKKFQKRHQKRIEKTVKFQSIKYHNENIISFILTNKSIIWAVKYEKNVLINELLNIRRNMDDFTFSYLNLFKEGDLLILIRQSYLKYHYALLTFIIDFIQVKSDQFNPDPRLGFHPVKQAFERSTIASLITICNMDSSIFNFEIFQQMISEYGLIIPEICKFKPARVINRLNNLISKVDKKITSNFMKLRD